MQTQGLTARDPSQTDALTGGGEGEWTQAMMRRDLYLLGRVAEVGVGLLEAMQRQVSPAAVEVSPSASGEETSDVAPLEAAVRLFQGDIALAYARVSRAVRMTIALRTRMIEEITEAERVAARNAQLFAEANAAAEELQRKARKGVVARVLTDVHSGQGLSRRAGGHRQLR